MKNTGYRYRFYRDWVKAGDLHLTRIAEKETDLQIMTDKPLDKDFVRERVGAWRRDIENYINKDKRFLTALKPISVEINAPPVVRAMSGAASKADVGPMAAVAGAVAEFLGRELLRRGYRDVIIENGGDIFIKTRKAKRMGIYAGRSKLWSALCLKIKPKDTPLGICASSGTIGHSLSFGSADSVVILSKSVALADAAATATCNRIQEKNDLQAALDFARSIKGVAGAVMIFKNDLISWGKVEFTK